jgi:hypothetical protein
VAVVQGHGCEHTISCPLHRKRESLETSENPEQVKSDACRARPVQTRGVFFVCSNLPKSAKFADKLSVSLRNSESGLISAKAMRLLKRFVLLFLCICVATANAAWREPVRARHGWLRARFCSPKRIETLTRAPTSVSRQTVWSG